MPKSVMPSGAKNGKASQQRKRKDLAMLAETPRLKRFFLAKLLCSNVKTVALTRAPGNVDKSHDITFEAPFILGLAGHIDMLFSGVFVCNLWFLFIVQLHIVSCRVTHQPRGSQSGVHSGV